MVGRGSSAYERELKDLLQGDRDAVREYGRSIEPRDRAVFERIVEHPFLVVRGAGSLGFDLVAIRREFALPVEVKASAEPTIHFSAASGRASEQLAAHRESVERVGLVAVYAYRRLRHRDGDPWRLFAASTAPREGRLGLLARTLPPVETTREGNAVLRWEHGLSLVRFVERVHFLSDADGGGRR